MSVTIGHSCVVTVCNGNIALTSVTWQSSSQTSTPFKFYSFFQLSPFWPVPRNTPIQLQNLKNFSIGKMWRMKETFGGWVIMWRHQQDGFVLKNRWILFGCLDCCSYALLVCKFMGWILVLVCLYTYLPTVYYTGPAGYLPVHFF